VAKAQQDPKGVVRQAGAVAVRPGPEPRYLLVRARLHPDHWLFPKGHIDEGETDEQTALRELAEEAGVAGKILAPVGSAGYAFEGKRIEVAYFVVEATGRAGAGEPNRDPSWLSCRTARDRIVFADLHGILENADTYVRGLARKARK
jgi:8-oxo-dGTP pyrophosphatase MutT (NUDIX family)